MGAVAKYGPDNYNYMSELHGSRAQRLMIAAGLRSAEDWSRRPGPHGPLATGKSEGGQERGALGATPRPDRLDTSSGAA